MLAGIFSRIHEQAFPVDCLDYWQGMLLLPNQVLLVAESANHHAARSELLQNRFVRNHRHALVEQRSFYALPHDFLETRVSGVDCNSHASVNQLGARRGDYYWRRIFLQRESYVIQCGLAL